MRAKPSLRSARVRSVEERPARRRRTGSCGPTFTPSGTRGPPGCAATAALTSRVWSQPVTGVTCGARADMPTQSLATSGRGLLTCRRSNLWKIGGLGLTGNSSR